MSPSGSGVFCWSFFDILRSATLLNRSFSRQLIDLLHIGPAANNQFERSLTEKGIRIDRKMKP